MLPVKQEIALSYEQEIPLYRNLDNSFFCLSEACQELSIAPVTFLRSNQAKMIFARNNPKKRLKGNGINDFVEAYPDLIYIDSQPQQN